MVKAPIKTNGKKTHKPQHKPSTIKIDSIQEAGSLGSQSEAGVFQNLDSDMDLGFVVLIPIHNF
jgi:hypothetical protein